MDPPDATKCNKCTFQFLQQEENVIIGDSIGSSNQILNVNRSNQIQLGGCSQARQQGMNISWLKLASPWYTDFNL